ncbi:E3 ubiquitin-protein ligase TRIM21-like [Denticeps clupeoides]|uniref:E3 ubiquitin-protein ligase TRIM21-like n=1 Tax=Denticeps clupeoides TaxID=299321 RepID=UPI0010A5300B|nr:E3 ubiquitin-protein ligase TRIM21-like [Denticeps clupeoides]
MYMWEQQVGSQRVTRWRCLSHTFIMKSILKEKKIPHRKPETSIPGNSIGVVRWASPNKELQVHNSAPSSSGTTKQKELSGLRSLQECVAFIEQWKQHVETVCRPANRVSTGRHCSVKTESISERSVEQCRKLILQWSRELGSVDTRLSQGALRQKPSERSGQKDACFQVEQRIMGWAKELQCVSESCGVMSEELSQILKHLEPRKRKTINLLPFLEFITWSILKEDSTVSHIWLSTKQKTWKTETPKYIPNSVWDWICSAAVDVTLDPMTNHPWLLMSEDHKKVQEAHAETQVSFSTQRFDCWPCVLGWEGLASGRHYWEVELANNGYWRLGVTTASSKRHGRFSMCPEEGYWVLWRSTRRFYACTKPESDLPLDLVGRRIGIYLDYEEGQISFYNVEQRAHIYTFSGCFHEKLYPLFAPLDGRTLMTVSSPRLEVPDP